MYQHESTAFIKESLTLLPSTDKKTINYKASFYHNVVKAHWQRNENHSRSPEMVVETHFFFKSTCLSRTFILIKGEGGHIGF